MLKAQIYVHRTPVVAKVTFAFPAPSLTVTEVRQLATDLANLASDMDRVSKQQRKGAA